MHPGETGNQTTDPTIHCETEPLGKITDPAVNHVKDKAGAGQRRGRVHISVAPILPA